MASAGGLVQRPKAFHPVPAEARRGKEFPFILEEGKTVSLGL